MRDKKGKLIEEDRYKRQTLLWGDEGQGRLKNARVAVVGLGAQGVYTSLCLAALGVGNLVLVDGSDAEKGEMFLDMKVPAGSRSKNYSELLQKINTQVNIEDYSTNIESRIDQLALDRADVIVDATNSRKSKELVVEFGREKDIPVLSTSSKWGYTKLMPCNGHDNPENFMLMFEGEEQDPLMALVMCGVVTEEVRKLVFNDLDNMLHQPVRYRLGDGYRFGFPQNGDVIPRPDPEKYAGLKAAFLGGGALGCWGAIPGSFLGLGVLDIFDYDKFDSTNINRQVLAYDGIDKEKASHIADKIVKMSRGKTKSAGNNVLILPGFNPETNYDIVFDFVDNRYTRAINAAYAISNNKHLISAGALPYSARWDVHMKGKTTCMDCMFNIYEEGIKEEMIRRASCAANPDPSVVMSNAVAAVNAVLDVFSIVEPEKYGQPFNGEQTYRSTNPRRFGTSPLKAVCDCYSKPIPKLDISQKDVDEFIAANPHLLEGED